MVPGQVITQETIDFMRKLDVKEIHGYNNVQGLKLVVAGGAGAILRASSAGVVSTRRGIRGKRHATLRLA